jgi:hypothetical protein
MSLVGWQFHSGVFIPLQWAGDQNGRIQKSSYEATVLSSQQIVRCEGGGEKRTLGQNLRGVPASGARGVSVLRRAVASEAESPG